MMTVNVFPYWSKYKTPYKLTVIAALKASPVQVEKLNSALTEIFPELINAARLNDSEVSVELIYKNIPDIVFNCILPSEQIAER